MKSYMKVVFVLVIMFSFFGCAPVTKITETWKDPNYAGRKIENVLVIAIAKKAGKRNLFENEFVQQFNDYGVAAHPSAAIIPKETKITREAVEAAIQGAGIDSVFVMKLIEVKEEEVYTPPQMNYSAHGYMGHMMNPMPDTYMPGYYSMLINVRLETTLYETAGGELVWSAISETYNPESAKDLLGSYKKKIMKDLKKNGFID
jgi:hypothetical protein